jgi:hypothetical protein
LFFKQRWVERYPQLRVDGSQKYEWGPEMGKVFVEGSPLEVDRELPGTFVVKCDWAVDANGSDETICYSGRSNKLTYSGKLIYHGFKPGNWIQIGIGRKGSDTKITNVRVKSYGVYVSEVMGSLAHGKFRLFDPEESLESEEDTYQGRIVLEDTIEIAYNSGEYIERVCALRKDVEMAGLPSRFGKISQDICDEEFRKWDIKSYFSAMSGSSHKLLPRHIKHMSEFSEHVQEQARHFFNVRTSHYALMRGTRMNREEFEAKLHEVKAFLRICITKELNHRNRLEVELQRIVQ